MEDIQELDVELLISLVRDRPVLWDKSLDEYKSRAETLAAWREVCSILNEDFEYLSDEAKNKYGEKSIVYFVNCLFLELLYIVAIT